jgi:hypothetical protein
MLVERVFADDGFDFLSALADGQDDPAVPRDLATGNEEIAGIISLRTCPDESCQTKRVARW